MPRHIRATALEVQKSRAEWYQFHYENRQRAQAMSAEQKQTYLYAASMIQAPQMTVFGGFAHDWPERRAYELAGQSRLDVDLINPWYLSDAGWNEFQRRWQDLPEPVDMYTEQAVQVGGITLTQIDPAELRR